MHGLSVAVSAFVIIAISTSAYGQTPDTGTLVLHVTGPDEAPLAGVDVVLRGSLGVRTDRSRADGSVYLRGLEPGAYATTLSRDGFATVRREDVRVSAGRTSWERVRMELRAGVENLTVRSDSPMIDLRNVKVAAIYPTRLIEDAPTASGLWEGVLSHVPGVVVGGVDVGGLNAAEQPEFSSRGNGFDQNGFHLNGSNTTDPVEIGKSLMYFSVHAFSEVSVSTGAHDIQAQLPGVAVDMVTKTGSNEWNLGTKLFWVAERFVARNVDEELAARGAAGGNATTLLRDIDLQGGGPIVRDRAWLFVDYWNYRNHRLIVGIDDDENETSLENWTVNGTARVRDQDRVSARLFTNRRFESNDLAGPSRPPEHVPFEDAFIDVIQGQYQGNFGPDTFLDARFSRIDHDDRFEAKHPGSKFPHPRFVDKPPTLEFVGFDLDTISGRPEGEGFIQRDRSQVSADLTRYAVVGDQAHDAKVGAAFATTRSFEPTTTAFGARQKVRDGVPFRVDLWNSPAEDIFAIEAPHALTLEGTELSLYAQDTWSVGDRLTVVPAFRLDRTRSSSPAQVRPVSFWPELGPDFQELDIPALDPAGLWTTWVPRVSAIYDLFGDGRTALKGSYAHYSFQQGVVWAAKTNPNLHGFYQYNWSDANGDGIFQLGEQGRLRQRNFSSSLLGLDPDLESPVVREITAGIEHQIADDVSLSVTYLRNRTSNQVDDINLGVPFGPMATTLGVPDSYVPIMVTDPGPDGVPDTADDGGPLTIFSQRPETEGLDEFFVTNPEKFGFAPFDRYDGVSIVVQKRWSDNWQLLGSWDIGRAESSSGLRSATQTVNSQFDDPNNDVNRAGLSPWDRAHMVKVTGTYLIAEPVGVNVGAFLSIESGRPLTRIVTYFRRDVDGLTQSNVRVRATPRGEDRLGGERLDTVTILDLRAEKQLRLGRHGLLHVYADVFNLFNTNTVTGQNSNSGDTFGNVNDLVPPRVFRIGLGWEF